MQKNKLLFIGVLINAIYLSIKEISFIPNFCKEIIVMIALICMGIGLYRMKKNLNLTKE